MYMTFFFQTNPIGVILKMILALLSSIIAVNGCFCYTVQNTSNKVHESIIKCASCGSGVWIKASCSESMRFCKKNVHISNVINTSLSLHLTVVSGNVGHRRCMISDECGERTKQNASHELEVQTEDLLRKMSEDFNISQEETGFPLVK